MAVDLLWLLGNFCLRFDLVDHCACALQIFIIVIFIYSICIVLNASYFSQSPNSDTSHFVAEF